LRIKAFLGTSENPVKTQIWIALATYVLIAIVKKRLYLPHSLYEILQILSLTMFETTPLNQLLAPPNGKYDAENEQIQLTDSQQPVCNGLSLTLFQKVLLTTDGSVTELLRLYSGEQITVAKIEQSLRRGTGPKELECSPDTQLLHRKIMLKGPTRNYVFAKSIFVFNRFSPSIQAKLLETEAPIGLLWRQEKVEMYREIIETKVELCKTTSAYFNLPGDSQLFSRTYLIFQAAKPLGIITEKFPATYFRQQN